MQYKDTAGLIIRKTYPELLNNHIRPFFKEYPFVRDWYNKSEKTIYWPNGSTTEFSYLQNTDDVWTYAGREYEDITVDEITYHEEVVFKILRSSNRTSNKLIQPTMLLTGNPGGIGHQWVRRLFIDREFEPNENPDDFAFVQAKVWDNQILLRADPDYIGRLESLPPDIRRAYLNGDWDVFSGQIFREFRQKYHVIKDIKPAESFEHYLWLDWGYSEKSACAIYLSVVIPQSTPDGRDFYRVITYKEFWGNQKHPFEWAKIVFDYCKEQKIKPRKCFTDPAIHAPQQSGETSIASLFDRKWKELNDGNFWCKCYRGANSGNASRINRVGMMHNWLSMAFDKAPYWVICQNCEWLIKTLPKLVYDEINNAPCEYYAKGQKEHGADACTYGLSQIRFVDVSTGGKMFTLKGVVEPYKRFDKEGKEFPLDIKLFGKAAGKM